MFTRVQLLLLACGIAMVAVTVESQNTTPLAICRNNTVAVSEGSSGVIQYRKREGAPATCSLVIRAPVGSYISIPRVFREPSCQIQIDGNTYCVFSTRAAGFIHQFTAGKSTINITVSTHNMPEFTLEYFNTVTVKTCGENITLPGDESTVEQLSGILTSSYPLQSSTRLSQCTTTISNLPGRATDVRVDILIKVLGEDNKIYINDQELSDPTTVYLVSPTNRQIFLRYEPAERGPDGADSVSFIIKFKVLTCGDVPQIKDTTPSTLPPSPWYPGTNRHYSCSKLNYRLKYNTTVECKVKDMTAIWVNQSEIRCIPVPYCVDEPIDTEFTNKHKIDGNTTVYECIRGYESERRTNNISRCYSDDKDNIPWRWSNISLTCTPVECKLSDLSFSTSTTYITSTGGVNDRYLFQSSLSYDCFHGYKKTKQEVIQCLHDKTWSSAPQCIKMVECNYTTLNLTNGDIQTDRYYEGDSLEYECDDGYKKSPDDRVLCTENGGWSTLPQCLPDPTNRATGEGGKSEVRGDKPLEDYQIALIGGGGGLIVLIVVVVIIVLRCVRKRPEKSLPVERANNGGPSDNPYSELEGPGGGEQSSRSHVTIIGGGAYDVVNLGYEPSEVQQRSASKPKVAKKPNVIETDKNSKEDLAAKDLYASVQQDPGKLKRTQVPKRNGPIYEEAPMIPLKGQVGQSDDVLMTVNDRSETSGGVDMVVNDLYDTTTGNVEMVVNDLYDTTSGNVDMVVNDLYDTANNN